LHPFPKAIARRAAPRFSIFHNSASVSIVVVFGRNSNVSARMETFTSRQTFHAVCKQNKQVFIIIYCALIENMQFLHAFSWFVCLIGRELHRFSLHLNFFQGLSTKLRRALNVKMLYIIESFFQLTGRVLLVHWDPIFCIDNE